MSTTEQQVTLDEVKLQALVGRAVGELGATPGGGPANRLPVRQ